MSIRLPSALPRVLRALLACVFVVGGLVLSVQASAAACTCQPADAERQTSRADAVFIGTVDGVTRGDQQLEMAVTATRAYKGTVERSTTVTTATQTTACGIGEPEVGTDLLFIVRGDAPPYVANSCDGTGRARRGPGRADRGHPRHRAGRPAASAADRDPHPGRGLPAARRSRGSPPRVARWSSSGCSGSSSSGGWVAGRDSPLPGTGRDAAGGLRAGRLAGVTPSPTVHVRRSAADLVQRPLTARASWTAEAVHGPPGYTKADSVGLTCDQVAAGSPGPRRARAGVVLCADSSCSARCAPGGRPNVRSGARSRRPGSAGGRPQRYIPPDSPGACGSPVGMVGMPCGCLRRAVALGVHAGREGLAHLLELAAGRHLLGVDRGLDAVEEPLEPADQLGLRDPQLALGGRALLGEGQRQPLELLDQLGRQTRPRAP